MGCPHLPSRLLNILSIFFSSLGELLLLPLLMASSSSSSSSSPLPSPFLTLKGTSSRSPSLPFTLHLPSDQRTSLPTLSTHQRELLFSVASISTVLPFHKPSPSLAREVESYQFLLPPTWKQAGVANIVSGDYCQAKCAEPWVQVKFESEKDGKVQVVASPLIRLTNKPNATIEDIGSPDKVIASLGPFVTGNTYDSDELIETSVEKLGDQTYSHMCLRLRDWFTQSCKGNC